MIRSQLNAYSGGDPIWGFVALIGTERFSGEAAVGIDPRVRLFAVDGRIYFAERDGDAPVGTRLVNCGAITAAQLAHGAVQLGDTSSLSRLFQREPSIDRDAVELTIEFATESLLASIANKPVGMPEVFPLRHHSTGIHHWLRAAAPSPAAPFTSTEQTPPAPTAEPVLAEPVSEPVADPVFDLPPLALAPMHAPLVAEPSIEGAAVEGGAVEDASVEDASFEEGAVEDTVAEPPADETVDEPVADTVPEIIAEPVADTVPEVIAEPVAETATTGDAESPWTEQARSSWQPDPAVYVSEPFAAEPVSEPTPEHDVTEALPALTPWAPIAAAQAAAPAPSDDPFAALDAALPSLGGGTDPLAAAPLEPVVSEPDVSEPVVIEPAASEPAASEPVASEPVASEPVASEPVVSEPVASEEPEVEAPPAEHPTPTPMPTLLTLPTLNGSNGHNGSTGHNGHAHGALTPLTPPTASADDEITATLPVTPEADAVGRSSDPFAALGGLTPLTSLTAPDPQPAPELATAAPEADSPAGDLFESLPERLSYEPGPAPENLPKLAQAPISMTDLKAANAEAAAAPFGSPTHTLAAVDIWEMVDVLMDDGQAAEQDLVNSGGSEKRSRGWLRGRKG